MGYPRGLDEFDEAELKDEIERRRTARANGRCDYCGGEDAVMCRFPARHAQGARRPTLAAEPRKNSCNRHDDCDAARAAAEKRGVNVYAGFCCTDECCEDCFGS